MTYDEIVAFHAYMEDADNKLRERNYEGALSDYTTAKDVAEGANNEIGVAQAQRWIRVCLEKLEEQKVM